MTQKHFEQSTPEQRLLLHCVSSNVKGNGKALANGLTAPTQLVLKV